MLRFRNDSLFPLLLFSVSSLFIFIACQDPSQTAGPLLRNVAISGSGQFKDGSPLVNQNIQITVTLGLTGSAIVRGNTSTDGSGAFFASFASPLVSLSQLESLRIDSSVPASVVVCQSYCSASGTSDLATCISDCSQGSRSLSTSQTLTRADLAMIEAESGFGSTIRWNGAVTFLSLGPTQGSGSPDLMVDGNAALQSLVIAQQSFLASDCDVLEGCVGGPGLRTLLRFDATTINAGNADLVLGSPVNNPLLRYDSCRQEYFYKDLMLYELLTADSHLPVRVGAASGTVGRKQGFCIMDDNPVLNTSTTSTPVYDCNNQGISVGWEDVYTSDLDCQWLDITGVPGGNYVLRLTVNPSGIFQDSNTSNNSADVPVSIPAGR